MQRNATQRNATQRNAMHVCMYKHTDIYLYTCATCTCFSWGWDSVPSNVNKYDMFFQLPGLNPRFTTAWWGAVRLPSEAGSVLRRRFQPNNGLLQIEDPKSLVPSF